MSYNSFLALHLQKKKDFPDLNMDEIKNEIATLMSGSGTLDITRVFVTISNGDGKFSDLDMEIRLEFKKILGAVFNKLEGKIFYRYQGKPDGPDPGPGPVAPRNDHVFQNRLLIREIKMNFLEKVHLKITLFHKILQRQIHLIVYYV